VLKPRQIVALLFAGSESTANVLSETLYELALNPSVQDRLREELTVASATRGGGPSSYDELMSGDQLPYLDAVMREAMRLKAVLMEISRCVNHLVISVE
jgi:cytochrome P450